MTPRAPLVELDDLQGNVLCGYGFPHTLYAFLRLDAAAAGRRLLGDLAPDIRNAVSWGTEGPKPDDAWNVAITHAGLRSLGVPPAHLESFPAEFRDGMEARAELLGDTGSSHPRHWDQGLRAGQPQLLVTVTARTPEALSAARDRVRSATSPGSGLTLVHEQEAHLLGGDREHFGFRDGFAQPSIDDPVAGPNPRRGGGTPARFGRWKDIAPGEFVLGYDDEAGDMPEAPRAPLERNGTYMVVRKLGQDVALFTQTLLDAADGDRARAGALAAKVVGRWPDGTPLARSPDRPMPEVFGRPEQINDFRYHGDKDGLHCPLGAHIRRANPRDALGWQGRRSVRHRIIRRGMPYGTRLADPATDDGHERGLMFVCYQASISRQFEVVQALWCNDGEPFGLGADRDFLLGAEEPEGTMTVPGRPPVFLHPLRSFVTTRGGDYFFVPGLRALRALADGIR